mgnify:CR=1 FL=1
MNPLSALLVVLLVGSMTVGFFTVGEPSLGLAVQWLVFVGITTYFASFVWRTRKHPRLFLVGMACACLALGIVMEWLNQKDLFCIFTIAGLTLIISTALLNFHYAFPGCEDDEEIKEQAQ